MVACLAWLTWTGHAFGDEGTKTETPAPDEKVKKGDSPGPDEKPAALEDPSPGMMVTSPTAFSQKKKTFNFFIRVVSLPFGYLPLFFHNMIYGITDAFEIRVAMLVPAGHVGFGLYPKYSVKLHRYVRIGLMLDLIYYQRFVECWDDDNNIDFCKPQFIVGGIPFMITVGVPNYFMNLSTRIFYNKGYDDECFTDPDKDTCDGLMHDHLFLVTSLGASIKIARKVKLSFELFHIFLHDFTKNAEGYSGYNDTWHILVPMIGFKVFGKRFYGGLSIFFVIPWLEKYSNGSELRLDIPLPTPEHSFGVIAP